MTRLLLIRHGETDWNRARRIQGLSDIPLNDIGRGQARAVGEALRAEFVDAEPAFIVSSDLSRAFETAEIIAAVLGRPVPRTYAGLRERGYGDAEGALVAEVPTLFGSADRDKIPGAELTTALLDRALQALRDIAADADREAPDAPVVAVAHGALIAEVVRHASAGEFPRVGERITNGGSYRFLLDLTLTPAGIRLEPDSAATSSAVSPSTLGSSLIPTRAR